MPDFSLPAVTRFRMDQRFYWRSAFQSRTFQISFVTLALLCVLAMHIAVRSWAHLSMFTIALIAIAMCFAISLVRLVIRSHKIFHQLLTSRQTGPTDEETSLEAVLGVVADFSNGALILSYFSILALLMAISAIMSGR